MSNEERSAISQFYLNAQAAVGELPKKVNAYDHEDAISDSEYPGEGFYVSVDVPEGVSHTIAVMTMELMMSTVFELLTSSCEIEFETSISMEWEPEEDQWCVTATCTIKPAEEINGATPRLIPGLSHLFKRHRPENSQA